jgi:hypothetical protein
MAFSMFSATLDQRATDPLAWPYHASAEDQASLPVVARTINGTCHAGDCILEMSMPDVDRAMLRDIKGFADSL